MKTQILTEVLKPFMGVDNMFYIPEDGRSQTVMSNKGRFGFWVEEQFGLLPNRSQDPDLGKIEIKSVLLKGSCKAPVFKDIAIGNMSWDEHWNLANDKIGWRESLPFQKTGNTLYVFYRRTDDYWYTIDRQVHVTFKGQSAELMALLERDFKTIRRAVKPTLYDQLKRGSLPADTRYIAVRPKGDAQYRYPCWHFTKEWVRTVYAAKTSG